MMSVDVASKVPIANVNCQTDTENANTAVVITLPAIGNYRHVITGIQISYSATPTGGRITVERGSTLVFDLAIPAVGPYIIPVFITGNFDETLVVTLAAGSGAVVGKLNIQSFETAE